jgi:Predicted transcriptional regulator containing an HTH domain and an uncharacterized domain shared with the mammalian protein Schlafen
MKTKVHRSYMGSFSQMRVYDTRINLWNEGGLPEGITLQALKLEHTSKPRNLLIAEVCFKGGLIDAWGRGTITIIDECKATGLHEPELTERDGGFLVTLFKNQLKTEQLVKLGLNQRQIKAVLYVKEKGKITNGEYQTINEIKKTVAAAELQDLTERVILTRIGTTGRSIFYELAKT